MPSEFARRARLYARIDDRLAGHTRFFGAAAAINWAFGALLAPIGWRLIVSTATVRFLSRVGAQLETINVESAHRIARAQFYVESLDSAMVRMEQSKMQVYLELKAAEPKIHETVISELDELLNPVSLKSAVARLALSGSVYSTVLRALLHRARPVSFANQLDRESIGASVIAGFAALADPALIRLAIQMQIEMASQRVRPIRGSNYHVSIISQHLRRLRPVELSIAMLKVTGSASEDVRLSSMRI